MAPLASSIQSMESSVPSIASSLPSIESCFEAFLQSSESRMIASTPISDKQNVSFKYYKIWVPNS